MRLQQRQEKPFCDEALGLFWAQAANDRYDIIFVTTPVVRRAVNLCNNHSLKGFDAIQLATALAARESLPEESALGEMFFLTEDQRLSAAAAAEGFVVDSPLNHA